MRAVHDLRALTPLFRKGPAPSGAWDDVASMKRILLVRHGPPERPERAQFISGRDISRSVAEYDEARIASGSTPPAELLQAARSASYVTASDLPRAMDSAALLANGRTIHLDPDLREAPVPDLDVPVRLPGQFWVVIARFAWLARIGRCSETAAASRARARLVAERLLRLASRHDEILVVSHGWFIRMLAEELRRRGCQGRGSWRSAYWSRVAMETE